MSTKNLCAVDGCPKPADHTRSMCSMHRRRVRTHGTTDPYPGQVCTICGAAIGDTGQRRVLCGAAACLRVYMTERARAHAATGRKQERVRELKVADPTYERARWLKARYGWSLDDYDRALAAQGGRCALCGTAAVGREFHVDHDPRCCPDGKGRTCGNCIRGLLCQRCNTGLGKFEDDPSLLRAAADYIASRTTQKEIPA